MLLLLTQRNVVLQVYYSPGTIEVLPLVADTETERLLHSTARTEERSAKDFLKAAYLVDPLQELTAYFTRRGWDVRRAIDLLTPVAAPGPL